MKNEELSNIEVFYKNNFPNLKVFKSTSELSGVPIDEKVYESLSGDYYYSTIISYKKEEVENSEYFILEKDE